MEEANQEEQEGHRVAKYESGIYQVNLKRINLRGKEEGLQIK